MPMSNAVVYSTATVAVSGTLLWVWLKWKDAQLRRHFRDRNIQFVDFPNLISQSFSKKHFEQEEYDRVKKYGKIFATKIFGQPTIFVADPELIQLILSKDFTSFTNRRIFQFDDPILKSFLSVAMDEQWKRIRAIVTPTFSTGKMRRMKPKIDETVQNMLKNIDEALKQSNVIEVKNFYGSFTMDTICRVAFGLKIDSLSEDENPMISKAKKMFSNDLSVKTMISFFLLFAVPRLAKLLNIRNDVFDYFKDLSLQVIHQKREEFKKVENLGKASNFLEMLLEAEAEHEKLQSLEKNVNTNGTVEPSKNVKYLTNDELISQAILFFIAAFDTTTSLITLASYFLALNETIQESLHEEIVTVIEKLRRESSEQLYDPLKLITFESLSQFEYLNAVVSETLRYFPPASLERTASRDIVLQNEDGSASLDLKKGDIVHMPVYAIHRDENWPDPEVFDPSRFIGPPQYHKYSYLPFGQGPRNCVARSLALMEAKLALLHVVYRYKLKKCSKTKVPVEFYNNGQILTPKDVFLEFEKR